MIKTLKDLFDNLQLALNPASSMAPADETHTLQLATAVLLVEVVRAEAGMNDAERDAVILALRRKFTLTDDEMERLLELAECFAVGLYAYAVMSNHLHVVLYADPGVAHAWSAEEVAE
ncbi:MAG: TerB family tellurite resistance protein, partial [Hydrogenophaga sp.]